MSEKVDRLKEFVEYTTLLDGDEKGEAQVFCDRLFKAFGHAGYKEAGAILEYRVKKKGYKAGTSFADLVWEGRLLLEMKKRGEKLHLYYQQAFDYWVRAVPRRPRFVMLCNFDEFWIYDFDRQIDTPLDVVTVAELPKRYTALNFLFAENPPPLFGNDREGVTREAADDVAQVFNALVRRGEDRDAAQRFILQTVVAMFAEDMDFLPSGLITQLVQACKAGASSYDVFGGLFRQMDSKAPAKAGRFKDVPYFNGGLFGTQVPIDLTAEELGRIGDASAKDWSKVNPAIFGALFQGCMNAEARHAFGAHYTHEADILRVVQPTIVRPWRERIEAATTMKELLGLRKEMLAYRVLDPACGSGNFLYVAYRELVRLEIGLLSKLRATVSAKEFERNVKTLSLISPRQFFGIDQDGFGIELAKVTLMLAKKLALDEAAAALDQRQIDLDLHEDHALPLDNLDANFICGDALFAEWPQVDAIIGNPPFQSKNKMQEEYGRAYVNSVRKRYPGVPGRADYCVYWFRRAHDQLAAGNRAGLVGTNTIRQNYSREGGLDYIAKHGGTITEAVSSQVWSGEAAVHVSIVNWVKGAAKGTKRLFRQLGDQRDSAWEVKQMAEINTALSFETDVTSAAVLAACAKAGGCFQGQTHGHEGFLLNVDEARKELKEHPASGAVLFPYLTADELLGEADSLPTRYVIDFADNDLLRSRDYPAIFARVESRVLPTRRQAAQRESERNRDALAAGRDAKISNDHGSALEKWWQLFRHRGDMLAAVGKLPRYIVCGRVTKRPIFEFVSSAIRPNDALMVFPYADDYSFGILQSDAHWQWFVNRCSTLTERFRYTSNTVFDTFAWPQDPSQAQIEAVADAAVALRKLRRTLMTQHKLSLRELYRSLESPGKHPLKDAHTGLDGAVRAAYGMGKAKGPLGFLLALNAQLAARELTGDVIVGPGLPPRAGKAKRLVTPDCVSV